MLKLHCKKAENAQGMVEFALVLPILLMVIMGVFAFGHLFFVYSTAVSASREAARFGAAVGNTLRGIPRYKDCDEIIAAAVRVGNFAGVTPSNVTITYDDGPGGASKGTCPAGGVGPELALGDRIIVHIQVQYTPIVPFVPMQSFPIEGETFRTIVKDLPVGEAPVAQDPCAEETLIEGWTDPSAEVGAPVGTAIQVGAKVKRITGTGTIKGKVKIEADGGQSCSFDVADSNLYKCSTTFTFNTVGNYHIKWSFEPDSLSSCILPSSMETNAYPVIQPDTQMTLVDDPATSPLNSPVKLTVSVIPQGGIIPTGKVTIVDVDYPSDTCEATLDSAGVGVCYISFHQLGDRSVKATYPGDSVYREGSFTITHVVVGNGSAPSKITITSDTPDPSNLGQSFTVTVKVESAVVGGGMGTPGGSFRVYDVDNPTDKCVSTLDASGVGSCTLALTKPGARNLRAEYMGDSTFAASSSPNVSHAVINVNTPTPTVTLTPTRTNTPVASPTPTACAAWKSPQKLNFVSSSDGAITGFFFDIYEPGFDTGHDDISRITVTYPSGNPNYSDPLISKIVFGGSTLWANSSGSSASPFSVSTWPNGADVRLKKGETKRVSVDFLNNLQMGYHEVKINFTNGCTLLAFGNWPPTEQ